MKAKVSMNKSVQGESIRKVAIASFIGTTIEWYDFFLYNAATGIVFSRLFFPDDDPLTGTLKAFGVYAVGFAARPIGGIVCGHFGDRIGRKSMLVLTLLVTGSATIMIGLLPTYKSIGIWAPILLVLLRIAQGFGIGGEWGGAVLMAVEHAPGHRRGFYGSWPQVGAPAGLFLSTSIFGLISKLPDDALITWGWRVPFLLSIVLVGFGLYIRLAIVESPEFEKLRRTRSESKKPILDVLRQHPKNVILAMGARLAENGTFYLYTAFIIPFATQRMGFSMSSVLTAISLAALIGLVTIPAYGLLSDILGRRPVYLFGAIFTGLFAFPFFWMVESSRTSLMMLAVVVALTVGHAAMYGPQASFFSEMFGTRVRYSGASLGVQLASVIAGGLSPLVATALLQQTNSSQPIAMLIVGMAAVTTISVFQTTETAHKDMASISVAHTENEPGVS